MSYKSIYVDVDLSEWEDDELIEELESRGRNYQRDGNSFISKDDAWVLGRLIRGGHMDEVQIFLEPLLAVHGVSIK
jgi:hypothetical protein